MVPNVADGGKGHPHEAGGPSDRSAAAFHQMVGGKESGKVTVGHPIAEPKEAQGKFASKGELASGKAGDGVTHTQGPNAAMERLIASDGLSKGVLKGTE